MHFPEVGASQFKKTNMNGNSFYGYVYVLNASIQFSRSVVSDYLLESPLDCKEIQPVHSEGDQPWDLFGRNDAKAETPVL